MTALPRAGRPRLLIVDDQPGNIRLIAEALRDSYELFFATTGERALQIASEGQIELVLLDVVMPGMDGFEVCRRLKEDPVTRTIPVIFVTAKEDDSDETRGFEVGGVDYIAKPIRPPVVRARVRTHVELKRAQDLLEEIASIDALTAVANRRRFDLTLATEWQRALRSSEPMTLAILDVDYFKNFNDTYGHARGDECLQAVAAAIAASMRRPADLVARYGGEEFALILPSTDERGASEVLLRVLDAVSDRSIEHGSSACAPRVTVSGGAVTTIPQPGQTSAAALQTADKLLYEAKHQGRNQMVHMDLLKVARRTLFCTSESTV